MVVLSTRGGIVEEKKAKSVTTGMRRVKELKREIARPRRMAPAIARSRVSLFHLVRSKKAPQIGPTHHADQGWEARQHTDLRSLKTQLLVINDQEWAEDCCSSIVHKIKGSNPAQ
jgi:hypothetical protein